MKVTQCMVNPFGPVTIVLESRGEVDAMLNAAAVYRFRVKTLLGVDVESVEYPLGGLEDSLKEALYGSVKS